MNAFIKVSLFNHAISIQFRAILCTAICIKSVESHVILCNSIQLFTISCISIQYRAISIKFRATTAFNLMEPHVISCNCMQFRCKPILSLYISCNPMHCFQCHAILFTIPCNLVQYHAIPWNIMQSHAVLHNALLSHGISYNFYQISCIPIYCFQPHAMSMQSHVKSIISRVIYIKCCAISCTDCNIVPSREISCNPLQSHAIL